MFKIVVVLLSIILASCSNIPLSTMMKFSNYQQSDFLDIDPRELRIKATINHVIDIDLSKATTLSVAFDSEGTNSSLDFQLEKIKTDLIPAKKGLFSDTPAYRVNYLKLTEQSINDFNHLIKVANDGTRKQGQFQAGLGWNKPINAKGETILFSVALKLSDNDLYFTLIDEFELALPDEG
mgnify:CR=1 FL=1